MKKKKRMIQISLKGHNTMKKIQIKKIYFGAKEGNVLIINLALLLYTWRKYIQILVYVTFQYAIDSDWKNYFVYFSLLKQVYFVYKFEWKICNTTFFMKMLLIDAFFSKTLLIGCVFYEKTFN